ALCLFASPAFAQIAPFNEAGVAAGHEHLRTSNQEAYNKFWTALGGVQQPMAPGGNTQIIKFQGVVLMAQNAAGGAGGGQRAAAAAGITPGPQTGVPSSEGSTIDYLGFKVKDLKGTLAKLAAINIQPMPGATTKHAFVMSPDDLKVSLK